MLFFNDFTTNNLQIQAFNSIKHYEHKQFAIDIVSMSINLSLSSKQLIIKKTVKQYIRLRKSNTAGIEFVLTLCKKNGYIEIYIRKKRTAEIEVVFVNSLDCTTIQKLRYVNDCNVNIVKALLFEFDHTLISYLRNGCSCKNKNILKFIELNICKPSHHLNVDIETPEYFLIV
jgi:hypothetical protein